jgi:hypothetical protein
MRHFTERGLLYQSEPYILSVKQVYDGLLECSRAADKFEARFRSATTLVRQAYENRPIPPSLGAQLKEELDTASGQYQEAIALLSKTLGRYMSGLPYDALVGRTAAVVIVQPFWAGLATPASFGKSGGDMRAVFLADEGDRAYVATAFRRHHARHGAALRH